MKILNLLIFYQLYKPSFLETLSSIAIKDSLKKYSMPNLSTTYLGLKLKNPIVAASSGLSDSIEGIRNLEQAGVSAIVLKSIFEEEIVSEIDHTFEIILYPGSVEGDEELEEQDVEFFENDQLDLGELSAIELALSLDPYPRKQGVSLEEAGPRIKGVEFHEESELDEPGPGKRRPFAGLAELRQKK